MFLLATWLVLIYIYIYRCWVYLGCTSGKINMELDNHFQRCIFRFHISFRECILNFDRFKTHEHPIVLYRFVDSTSLPPPEHWGPRSVTLIQPGLRALLGAAHRAPRLRRRSCSRRGRRAEPLRCVGMSGLGVDGWVNGTGGWSRRLWGGTGRCW